MKSGPRFALLLPMAALLGCGLPPTPSSPGAWQNWQIQAGTAITSPPNTYPSFLGATQVLGTQAAGVFTTVATAATTGPPLDYTGSFNSSTGDVTLATFGFGFGYILPATPYTLVPVGVTGGCVYPPGYTGVMCNAIFAVPAVGVQIAPLNGTYTGTLTDSATPSMKRHGHPDPHPVHHPQLIRRVPSHRHTDFPQQQQPWHIPTGRHGQWGRHRA